MQDPMRPDDKPLLYDPLFETPPDTVIRDDPRRGFWGKSYVRKTAFIIVLSLFVGFSITLSFHSLTKDRFRYEDAQGGRMLSEFNADKSDTVLEVGPVFDDDGNPVPGETVTAVREFAVCGNEYTLVILIGEDVAQIPDTAFYNCSSLQAVIVDKANPFFLSSDGVLYRQENGQPTELMLYPARNDVYRSLLALGVNEPANTDEARSFAQRAAKWEESSIDWLDARRDDYSTEERAGMTEKECAALSLGLRYEIIPGISRIGEMAFAECDTLFEVTIPEGVTVIASMAFFKCGELRAVDLPESLETIGSDAFSYCAKAPDLYVPAAVKQIGHHAFFGCDSAENVRMACDETNAPDCGQDWLPKRRKLFMHDVPVLYGEERTAS